MRTVLLAALLAACGAEEEALPDRAAPNWIANPSVESGDGTPAGWTFLADDGVDAHAVWTTGDAADGARSLRVEVAAGSGPGHARWWFDPVELPGGRFYEYADLHRSYGRGRLVWSCEREGARRFQAAWQSHPAPSWERTSFRFYVPESCAVTVMHLLDEPGWLETDAHELREAAPAPLARPLISFAFDDGYASAASIVAPALEARGMRGSFYVPSEWIGAEGRLAAADLHALVAAGHEIASHGASHRPLPEVPARELRDEIDGSLRQLAPFGASGGLAYPFGEFDEVVESYARSRARYLRTSLQGPNDATADRARIRIHPVTAESTTGSLLAAVDDAERTSTWLVLLFHDLGEPSGGDPYSTDRGQFETVLDHVASRGITVLPVVEALDEAVP